MMRGKKLSDNSWMTWHLVYDCYSPSIHRSSMWVSGGIVNKTFLTSLLVYFNAVLFLLFPVKIIYHASNRVTCKGVMWVNTLHGDLFVAEITTW